MKLAEALAQRADMQEKLAALSQRMLANLKVQEGDKPQEDPLALLKQADALQAELCAVVQKINRCNMHTQLADGRILADALMDRDALLQRRARLAAMIKKSTEQDYRLTRSEIKMTLVVPTTTLQKMMDAVSKQYRELDTQIQSINWTVDL